MRTIRKRQSPKELVEWRQHRISEADMEKWPFDYDSLRRSEEVIVAVERALHAEQGGICAYTGMRLRFKTDGRADFHIEHVKAQKWCERGEDTEYTNLLACWPEPNSKAAVHFGAPRKGDWPAPGEEGEFVSPLRHDCSERFVISTNAKIRPAQQSDDAASTTIGRLGLQENELIDLRKQAIRGALSPKKGLRLALKEVRKLQTQMEQDERDLDGGGKVQLRAFCFAIKPAVERQVKKLEAIRKNRKN